MSDQDWILRGEYINELVQESLKRQVALASSNSLTDIEIRVNGEWLRFEADWVKYLEPLSK
jgi:beta-galactosidase/beta-glucuronidase